VITLQPITDANRGAVEALRVAPGQERYVSGVAESIREAEEYPGAHAIQWALYDGDTPVGFVMVADEVDDPEYVPHYLWKLLIDARHQRKGYGTAALDLVVGYFRGRPGVEALTTSAREGEGSPIPFYERYGFRRVEDAPAEREVLMRYELPR